MAKYENPAELDYRNGGDTVDDFAQKYMRTVDYIIKALNDLRTPTGNTAGVEPEPYMWRIADNKLYIRNGDNTDYVLLGEISPNFGFRQSVNDRFLTTADLEGDGAVVTRNEAGKVEGDITGSPGKIANKTIDVTPSADNDVIAYDAAQQKWVKKTLNDYLKKQGDAGWDEMVDEVADQVINDITPIIFNFWYLDDDGYLVPLVGSTEGGLPSIHGMVGDYEQITARSVDVAGNLSATGNVTAGMVTTPQANVTTLTANAVNAGTVAADDIIAKGPIVDVRAFGAKGDGVTDDTAAIQNALNTGNKVYFSKGRYRITETLSLYAGAVICGDSRRKTFLVADGCDFATGGGNDISHIEISNLTIQGDSTHVGLNISGGDSNNGGRYSVFYKVDFSGFDTDVMLGKCWCVAFYSCRFNAENICVQQNNECLNITYIGCQFLGNTDGTTNYGCKINETDRTTVFDKCDFERLDIAVYTAGGSNVSIINFHAEEIRSYLVYVNATANVKVTNGYCYNVNIIGIIENTNEYNGVYVIDVENINMIGAWDSATNMVIISNSNTNANIKNINISNSGSGNIWLCSIDSSQNTARKDNVRELIETESFSTETWGTKNFVNTIYKNSYESIKAISAYLTVLEDFTTSTSTPASVIVSNNNVEIFRMNIPSGTYTKGSKINANRSSSTITDYITDDLSNVTVTLNSPTSVTTSCKVSILFGVGEMKAIS